MDHTTAEMGHSIIPSFWDERQYSNRAEFEVILKKHAEQSKKQFDPIVAQMKPQSRFIVFPISVVEAEGFDRLTWDDLLKTWSVSYTWIYGNKRKQYEIPLP